MASLGPTFPFELIAAGLKGLPISWGSDGSFSGLDALTSEQQSALKAVVAAHDPTKLPAPSTISDRQFFQQLAILGAITPSEALAAVKTGDMPASLQAFVNTLPADQAFAAQMLLSGATIFERNHPMTVALASGLKWTDEQLDDLWLAASQL